MSPDDLSAKGTESGEQKAVFAWAAMARMYGFSVADNMQAYHKDYFQQFNPVRYPVDELAWLHSIPNGGERSAKAGALMKAEGARKGVADMFLPVPRLSAFMTSGKPDIFCGLYIEMKVGDNKQSPEQKEFQKHCEANGYRYKLCYSWREAANQLHSYLTMQAV